MTAPLQLNKNYTNDLLNDSLTVDAMLLRAIKDNNMREIEMLTTQMINRNTSESHLYTFYRYAHVRKQEKIGEYIKNILHVHYNMSEKHCQ